MEKKVFIYAPCTPANLVKREISECYKVKMTCGGGMGGSVWDEYLKLDLPLGNTGIVIMNNIFGEKLRINTAYAVKSERVRIVSEVWDTLQHANYSKERFKSHVTKRWYSLELFREAVFIESPDCNRNIKPIKELVEYEDI